MKSFAPPSPPLTRPGAVDDAGTDAAQAAPAERRRVDCCSFCRTAQWVGDGARGEQFRCVRCGAVFPSIADLQRSLRLSSRYALLGVILLTPAFSWPMLTVQQFLQYQEAGLIKAVFELIKYGEYFLAAVIGVASVAFPVAKLGFLLVLTSPWAVYRRHSRWTYAALRRMNWVVEKTGRWGMLEVFLVGVMVFAFRLSNVFQVDWKIGTAVFTLMVYCTMAAGEHFRPEIYGEVFDERRERAATHA